MKKYLAVVSYLGGAYKGFERQKTYPSIQGELEKALSFLAGSPSTIHGAGRTDAGVNAKGQTFSFTFSRTIDDFVAFIYAYNRLLPKDISIVSLQEVPLSFDARHSAIGKEYTYSFSLGSKDALTSSTIYELGARPFNIDKFKEALELYNGRHNFQDFTSKVSDKDSFIREVKVSLQEVSPKIYEVTFISNGFMTYQVRIMMGVLFKIGLGQLEKDYLSSHLDDNERHIISYKAAPEGLCLRRVIYG